jgi:hypothetical protein
MTVRATTARFERNRQGLWISVPCGVARAAAEAGLPAVISFTVETDARLPSGQPLGESIEQVDRETGGRPSAAAAAPTTGKSRRSATRAVDAPGASGSGRARGSGTPDRVLTHRLYA